MEDVGPTQAIFSMPHGILLLSFRIHKNPKGIEMILKVNIHGMNQLRSNWSRILIPVEEEEAFWSYSDTWTRFPSSMTTMMNIL